MSVISSVRHPFRPSCRRSATDMNVRPTDVALRRGVYDGRMLDRISIELTNACDKACWFCYNHSLPAGGSEWTVAEVVDFARDCAANGVKAISLGGGEPLQFDGVFEVLEQLRGVLFRSLTTNGLRLHGSALDRLVAAAPDKVHLSIHFPERHTEVERIARQVQELSRLGIRSGVNLLVPRSKLTAAREAARRLSQAGIENDRIVYLPMRIADTPTPEEVAEVAGRRPFQSMSCLSACAKSPRFCSIAWDKTVAWCSYTAARRPLQALTYRGLTESLNGLGLDFCGDAPLPISPQRSRTIAGPQPRSG